MAKTTYRQRRLKRRMYSARRRKKSRIKSRARSRRSRAVTSSLANQVFNKRKPRLPGIGKCRLQGGPSRGRDNARPYRARRGRGRGRGNVRSSSSSSSGPSESTPEAFQWFVGILIYGTIALMCMAGSLPAAPLVIWYCVSSGLGMLWNGACKLWDHRTEIRDDIFHHIVQEYFDFVYNDERHLAPNALGPGFGGIRTFLRLVCRYNGPHFVVNPCGRVRPNEQEVEGVVTEVPLESADDNELNVYLQNKKLVPAEGVYLMEPVEICSPVANAEERTELKFDRSCCMGCCQSSSCQE